MTGLLERSFLAAAMIVVLIFVRVFLLHRLPKITFQIAWAVVILRLLIPYSVPVFSADMPEKISWVRDFFGGNLDGKTDAEDLIFEGKADTKDPIFKGETDIENRNMPNSSNNFFDQKIEKEPQSGVLDGEKENFGKIEEERTGVQRFYPIFQVIWLAGMLIVFLYFLLSHLRARSLYTDALPAEHPLPGLNKSLEKVLIRRRVKIKVSDRIFAPVTCGLFSPVIVLPKNTDWENDGQLRMVLEHEIVHIRRLDILYKWLLAAAVAIHWFNPFVLVMYVLANRDIELSCDETVIRCFENGRKKDYALALLNYEEKRMVSPTVTGFGVNAVKERMKAMMKLNKTSVFGMAMSVVLIAGTTTAFADAKDKNIDSASPSKEDFGYFDISKGYLCEPAYYTLEEFEEVMGLEREEIMAQLEEGTLTKEDADRMFAEIEEKIREVKNGKQIEKPSPVYNADGTPLITSKGDQLYAKASDIAQINKEMQAAAVGRADRFDSVEEDTVITDKDMQNKFSYDFVQPDWYSEEEYQKYVEKQKEEYRSMLGEWGYNPTDGWYEWDEKKIEEACRQLDENLEFVKNGGKISKPDTDGTVFMTSSFKLGGGDLSKENWVMTLEEAREQGFDVRMADKVSLEGGDFDPAFLEAYEAFGVTANKKKCLYFYEGEPVAGLWDAGVVMMDGLAMEENGIYLKGVRKENKLVGFEKITKEEFCKLTGLTIK